MLSDQTAMCCARLQGELKSLYEHAAADSCAEFVHAMIQPQMLEALSLQRAARIVSLCMSCVAYV